MPDTVTNLSRTNISRSAEHVVFGDVTYTPRGTCGPRRQPDYQLVVVLEGPSRVQVDGEWLDLEPHQARLFQPGHLEYFEFNTTAPTRHIWCAVAAPLAQERLPPIELPNAIAFPYTPRLQTLFNLAFETPPEGSDQPSPLLQQIALTILCEATRAAQRRLQPPHPDSLTRCLQYLASHYDQPLKQNDLARRADCAPQHLRRLFKKHLSITPSDYLWNLRLEKGLDLLQSTGLSVSEIAYRVGFQNPFHFSRLIKRRYGLPPLKLRQEAWKPLARPPPKRRQPAHSHLQPNPAKPEPKGTAAWDELHCL